MSRVEKIDYINNIPQNYFSPPKGILNKIEFYIQEYVKRCDRRTKNIDPIDSVF